MSLTRPLSRTVTRSLTRTLSPTDFFGSASPAAISAAATLASGYTQALALDFTDDFFQPTTGLYGSAYILDTTTPANDYDSSPDTAAASLLTYTAPSLKMTRQADGNLAFQAHNLVTQSNTFTDAAWAKTGSPTVTAGQTDSLGGSTATRVTASGSVDTRLDNSAAAAQVVGQTYTIELDVKYVAGSGWIFLFNSTGASGPAWFNVQTGTVGTVNTGTASITSLGGGYYRCRHSYTASGTGGSVRVEIVSADGGSTAASGDSVDICFYKYRRTPSVDIYMATTTAARYALPLEWDAAGNPLGLLVEEARTNSLLYSDDLTNTTNWQRSASGVTTAKTATGPDGVSNSATTFTSSAANAALAQYLTSTSAARSGSVYLKRRTGTGAVTVAIGGTTGSDLVTNGTFDSDTAWTKVGSATISGGTANFTGTVNDEINQNILTAGKFYRVTWDQAVTTQVIMYAGTTSSGNRMHAVSVNGTASANVVVQAGSTGLLRFYCSASGTGTIDNVTCTEVAESTIDLSGGGWVRATIENKTITNPCLAIKLATSGDAVDVALGQIETGAYVTSPIPTLGSTVTRAADNISKATSAFPYSATAGTVYIDATLIAGTFSRVISFGDGGNNANDIEFAGTALTAGADGSVSVTQPTGGTPFKLAGAWASNDLAATIDGAAVSTDSSVTLPTGTTTFRLGRQDSANVASMFVRKLLYVPERLSNADMQTLTS